MNSRQQTAGTITLLIEQMKGGENMSGGSRNYTCFAIDENLVGKMYDAELDDLMADISKLAHEVEWWDSGDTNEEQYRKAVKKFKKKWFGTDRNERLKGYIDEKLAELKSDMYKMSFITFLNAIWIANDNSRNTGADKRNA